MRIQQLTAGGAGESFSGLSDFLLDAGTVGHSSQMSPGVSVPTPLLWGVTQKCLTKTRPFSALRGRRSRSEEWVPQRGHSRPPGGAPGEREVNELALLADKRFTLVHGHFSRPFSSFSGFEVEGTQGQRGGWVSGACGPRGTWLGASTGAPCLHTPGDPESLRASNTPGTDFCSVSLAFRPLSHSLQDCTPACPGNFPTVTSAPALVLGWCTRLCSALAQCPCSGLDPLSLCFGLLSSGGNTFSLSGLQAFAQLGHGRSAPPTWWPPAHLPQASLQGWPLTLKSPCSWFGYPGFPHPSAFR